MDSVIKPLILEQIVFIFMGHMSMQTCFSSDLFSYQKLLQPAGRLLEVPVSRIHVLLVVQY